MTTDLTALPPERLGHLLRSARRHASLSRRRAANIAALSAASLIAIERGWETPSQVTLAALLNAYGTTTEQLLPPRSRLAIDGTNLALMGTTKVHVAASSARDDLLRGYIKLVTDARDNGALDTLSLRSADVSTLATALGTDDALLVERIAALLKCDLDEAASIGRVLRTFAGPILGVAFSVTVIGGSVVAGNTSGAHLLPASADTPSAEVVVSAVPETTAANTANVQASSATATSTSATLPQPSHLSAVESDSDSASTYDTETSDATPATITMSGPTTTRPTTAMPVAPTPDIGLLPGEAPTQIFEG